MRKVSLPILAVLLVAPAVAAERTKEPLPFGQRELVVCSDDAGQYLEAIRSQSADRFGHWIKVLAASPRLQLEGTRRVYVGHPVDDGHRPTCLDDDPQLSDFLDYFLRYVPRTISVPTPTRAVPAALVATGAESPLNTVADHGAIAVYVCFSESTPCLEELTGMVLGAGP